MKIIKFGGKSLSNGKGIENVISILSDKINNNEKIAVVLSARGDTTNLLEQLLDKAISGNHYGDLWTVFKKYQIKPLKTIDYSTEFKLIEEILKGVKLTKEYSLKIKDLILAQGELMSVKLLSELLKLKNIKNERVDTRAFLKTNNFFGSEIISDDLSKKLTCNYFPKIPENSTPIITGFIASNIDNETTTTLGRNGSNYTASLIANYLDAEELISYTHVNGIYTANPELVDNAKVIKELHYNEASELASFGSSILHANTISPLVKKNIPLRILNTFKSKNKGTLISKIKTPKGIKSISVQEEISLITIEGKGLLGKVGIDARIFFALNAKKISVGIVSQGSSERAVSFVIPKNVSKIAQEALLEEFQCEISKNDIQSIKLLENLSVVTIIGQTINDFAYSLKYLKQNKIQIHLINNTIQGNNISLIIDNNNLIKAINIIHSQIFEAIKTINIAIIGKGTVGGTLINQIINSKSKIEEKKGIRLNIFAIAGSKKVILEKNDILKNWLNTFNDLEESDNITHQIIAYAKANNLENTVAIDNTASVDFIENYISFIENGFDLISSNKIANTQNYFQYRSLRETIKKNNKHYLYETNVGAGLPIIDTIRILHESGENITQIRGVFSGSLSYLFNSFSTSEKPFSYFLEEAVKLGYVEPDPREDLCGHDVARKLLILARELDLTNEFEDVEIENLIPIELRTASKEDFLKNISAIDTHYQSIKDALEEGKVLRYVGNLVGNLQESKGELTTKLISVDQNNALGNLKGSDSIIEIFTESYGANPITIIGAGAGAEVTARGVFGDLLRIADKK